MQSPAEGIPERYFCPRCRAVFRTAFARCPLDGTRLQTLGGADSMIGVTVADRYVIELCVGEGAMGRVYRARHRRMSRIFAIKVLFGDCAADVKMRSRFAREAETASSLDHPNLVEVIDFGETEEGLLYLVMPFIQGPTLGKLIRLEAPLASERIVKLTKQLCKGLGYAHDRGLVHRDFKADNVLVSQAGEEEIAKITDFGIAVMREQPEHARLTTDGTVIGTPAVMSPEQARADPLDHRTDLFSLGVVLYEMMCGQLPFSGTPIDIARHNVMTPPPPIRARVPGLWVDPELERCAMRLMAKDRNQRYQRAADLLAVLNNYDGLATPAAPVGRPSTPWPVETSSEVTIADGSPATPRSRWAPRLVAALAALGLVAIGVAVSLPAHWTGGEPETARAPGPESTERTVDPALPPPASEREGAAAREPDAAPELAVAPEVDRAPEVVRAPEVDRAPAPAPEALRPISRSSRAASEEKLRRSEKRWTTEAEYNADRRVYCHVPPGTDLSPTLKQQVQAVCRPFAELRSSAEMARAWKAMKEIRKKIDAEVRGARGKGGA